MISPGDCDPPGPIRNVLDRYLGTNYLWYPVVGNHDAAQPSNMLWLRQWARAGIPHLVRRGPPGAELTTFSFDFDNSHFVAVNDYYDGRLDAIGKGDVPEATLKWLETDLAATKQPLIWVVGHKPIESRPDMDTGRRRHENDEISANAGHLKRFVELLKQYHVRAYLCGHTHDSSVEKVRGVWQADSGHARGGGGVGAPSTFLRFRVSGSQAWVDVYRADPKGVKYQLRKTVELD
jgi:predicted phosphodiesterase